MRPTALIPFAGVR